MCHPHVRCMPDGSSEVLGLWSQISSSKLHPMPGTSQTTPYCHPSLCTNNQNAMQVALLCSFNLREVNLQGFSPELVPSSSICHTFTNLSLEPVAINWLSREKAQHVTYLQEEGQKRQEK